MSRSCQSAMFSSPTSACRAHDAREAADLLGDLRVALVRHRRRALLPAANGSSTSRDLGPRSWRISIANRSSDAAQIASAESSSAWRSRGDHLRRHRVRLEAEPLAGDALDLGVDRGVGADRAGELADANASSARRAAGGRGRARTPSPRASAERRRLGVNAVRAADHRRVPVLLGAPRRRRRARGRCPREQRRRPRGSAAPARCRRRPTTSGRSASQRASGAELLGDRVENAATSWSVVCSISATRSAVGATAPRADRRDVVAGRRRARPRRRAPRARPRASAPSLPSLRPDPAMAGRE